MYIVLLFLLYILETASGDFCHPRCDRHSYCCAEDRCCPRHGYAFYSMWYFWFIIGLLILSCAASCSYYRRRRRMLALRRRMQTGVVMFSAGNRQHAPSAQIMPPSYQEATDKSLPYPPPYYAIDPYKGQSIPAAPAYNQMATPANLPPYPGTNYVPTTNFQQGAQNQSNNH